MKPGLTVITGLVLLILWSGSAGACPALFPLDLGWVRHADLVVVGIVRDYPETSEGTGGLYVRFRVEVLKVLYGQAPPTFPALWFNSTYPYPDSMPAEPQMMAFTRPQSSYTALRFDLLERDDASRFVVLQQSCSSPFIFSLTDAETDTVRDMLERQR